VELAALEFIGRVWSSPGVSTERQSLFLAPYRLSDRTGQGGGARGEHEGITVVERPLAALAAAADRAEIADAKLFSLVQTLRLRRPELFAPAPDSRTDSNSAVVDASRARDPGEAQRRAPSHRKGGWLRAAVLGADDGILSTASLVLGVAAAHGTRGGLLIAGVAGLVAGAMSMAAGEYVSVHSQADTEEADLTLERNELRTDDKGEHEELAQIYVGRGLDPALAKQVAAQLMAHDALGAHARDELGITDTLKARPVQAAVASAASFAAGAAVPLFMTAIAPLQNIGPLVAGTSLVCLAALGAMAARTGGAKVAAGMIRAAFWGALAMAVTAGVGALVGRII
jgi:VIT1/CCC1 family predicted Fe2+/Mn2+ transporter